MAVVMARYVVITGYANKGQAQSSTTEGRVVNNNKRR